MSTGLVVYIGRVPAMRKHGAGLPHAFGGRAFNAAPIWATVIDGEKSGGVTMAMGSSWLSAAVNFAADWAGNANHHAALLRCSDL